MNKGSLRLLLARDSTADTELVRQALHEWGTRAIVERTDTEIAFGNALRDVAPDAVLVDCALGFGALTALGLVRNIRPKAPVILLANSVDERTIVECIRGGAEDLVLASRLSRLGDVIAHAISARTSLAALSPRQLETLRMVAEGRSTREVAELLGLSAKTVESHRGALLRRLGLHDVSGLVRFAIRMGLVGPVQGDERERDVTDARLSSVH